MSNSVTLRLRLRQSARASGALVSAVGALVLVGWWADAPRLVNLVGGEPMRPATAALFFLVGAALLAWLAERPHRLAARLLGGVVAAFGALTVVEYVTETSFFTAVFSSAPDLMRMALPTAIVFMIAGLALAFFDDEIGSVRVAEVLGLLCVTCTITAGLDLLLGVFDDGEAPRYQMAVYTALLFLLVSAALIVGRADRGWIQLLTEQSGVSRESRRLLALVLPIIGGLSLLRFVGEQRGFYDTRFGVALMAGAMFLLLTVTIARALRQLQRSQAEVVRGRAVLDAIIENIPHMIFVKDGRELRFVRFNAAGERLLGVKREELIGKNDFDFFPKEQAEFFQAKDRAALDGGAPVDIVEEEIATAHGKRWLHTIKVPVQLGGAHDEPPFLLGISEDITARKAVDDELRLAKETAEATSKELEAFSYSVSHDLRAPLRSIDGFSLAVMEDAADQLDVDSRKNLERVRAAAQKMATLIDDLLNLSRVSRQPLREEPVDLTAIAESIFAELRRAEPHRQVEVAIAPELRAVGDPHLIEVMLQNLIGNAWKFTGKKSVAHIVVDTVDVDGERRFFVKDDGAGFDMGYANKLFGAFQRLHSAAEFEGTGIGLATVQRIARRHGGEVWAEGTVDQGARFTFRLGKGAPGSTLSSG